MRLNRFADTGITSTVALSSALLFAGCGSPDSGETTDPSSNEDVSEIMEAPRGQPLAAGQAPHFVDAHAVDVRHHVPKLDDSSRLVDKSHLVACNVNFNSSLSLSIMPYQAWDTFALSPFYIQNCGDDYHWVYTNPLNMNHYHVGFEFQSTYNFCFGTPYKIGQMIGSGCANVKDAKLWPRNASNMQSGSGIEFYARTYDSTALKLFDLKSIRILSGPAKIVVYRTDISSWWEWTLAAGTWTFPYNSTRLRHLHVYHRDWDGIFTIDDVKLDVRH